MKTGRSLLVFLSLLGALHGSAFAAEPVGVDGFDAEVWRAWRDRDGGSRVVLFSTTFCAHCPALVEALADRLAREGLRAELHVVIMDREPDPRHRALYRRAGGLHVFDDNPARIRHAIEPSWRGGTPFVALLAGDASAPSLSLGAPAESAWVAWAARQVRRP